MKTIVIIFLAAITQAQWLFGQDSSGKSNESQMESVIRKKVESRKYYFVAQSVRPMGGGSRQVTGYGIILSGDSLQCHLPYIGQSFNPAYGSAEGGIDFSSSTFDYTTKNSKSGGWDVTIAPKKIRDVSKISLSIAKSGNTSVSVTSHTRQSISYYGYIQ